MLMNYYIVNYNYNLEQGKDFIDIVYPLGLLKHILRL